jgi:predicted ATPase/DNA-binding SARP family transcriptional activator
VDETRSVEIRVLGAFELLVDGRAVRVGGAGERALLARLASWPAKAVTADRLIDDLWEDRLPADPRNALQLRVSKLRKLVGAALVREPAGYRLDVAENDVDASWFRQLVAERRYDEALSLWRGAPYDEFVDQDWARLEAGELSELRAVAVEERLQARLDAGEGAALVPELVALVAEDPLRERRRGQLMQALYRTGRTADALATYRELRQLLRDELGLTPSAGIRQVEEAILREDESLGEPTAPAHSPSNLPAFLTRLIGRDEELGKVPHLLERSRLLTLVGPGGAGKTTLAVAAARQIAERYRHGAWFVPLANVRDPSQLASAVADTIRVSDPDARSILRVVSAWLSTRTVLLVVDNCEHLVDACAELVQELLASAASLNVIATSREPLGIPGEVQMRVPPLGSDDAVRLFEERAAAVRPDFALDGIEDEVRRIAERLDGMPLAIELAAARVNTMTVGEILAGLDDRFRLLTRGPRTAEERHRTLRGVVDWSYELLGDAERLLLRRLAVFRGGWTLEAAASVAVDTTDVLESLSGLVDRSLISVEGGRFGMLETIRAYSEARLIECGEYAEARRQHVRYYTDLAERAEPELRGGEQGAWLSQLRSDDANFRAALDWAREDANDPIVALRLAGALGWYWYVGRQMDGLAQLRATLEVSGGGSGAARARALQALSLAARPAGCIVHPSNEAAEAARESLTLFGDSEPERAALSRLLLAVQGVAEGDMHAHLGEVGRARGVLHSHGDVWGTALADFVEMEIRLHHGAVDEALPYGERAAAAFDSLRDDWGRSAVRLHLGHGLRLAGRTGEAEEVLVVAVELSRETGLPNNLARSYVELGEAALQRGAAEEAEAWFDAADEIADDVGSETLLALVLLGRGGVGRWRCETSAAQGYYRQALEISLAAAIPRGEARARAGLAATALDEGQVEAAVAQLTQTVSIARRIGDLSLVALALEQSSRAVTAAGDERERARLRHEADELRSQQGRPRSALEQRDVSAPLATG